MKKMIVLIFIALAIIACGVDTLKPDELTFTTLPDANEESDVGSLEMAIIGNSTAPEYPIPIPDGENGYKVLGKTGSPTILQNVSAQVLNLEYLPNATKLPTEAYVATITTTTVTPFIGGNPGEPTITTKVDESQVNLTIEETKAAVVDTGAYAEYKFTLDLTYPPGDATVPPTAPAGDESQTNTSITIAVKIDYEKINAEAFDEYTIKSIGNTKPTFEGTIDNNEIVKKQIEDFTKGNTLITPEKLSSVNNFYVAVAGKDSPIFSPISYDGKDQVAPSFTADYNNGEISINPDNAEIGTKYKIWIINRAKK